MKYYIYYFYHLNKLILLDKRPIDLFAEATTAFLFDGNSDVLNVIKSVDYKNCKENGISLEVTYTNGAKMFYIGEL